MVRKERKKEWQLSIDDDILQDLSECEWERFRGDRE